MNAFRRRADPTALRRLRIGTWRATVILGSTALSISAGHADQGYDACIKASNGTGAGFRQCGIQAVERAEATLAAAWDSLRPLAGDEAMAALQREQTAWRGYADTACDFLGDQVSFGTIGSDLEWFACRITVLEQRLADIDRIAGYLRFDGRTSP